MWPTLQRARRRISGGATPVQAAAPAATATGPLDDVVLTLCGPDVESLREALQEQLGDTVERPDTPVRIERALAVLIAQRGGHGRPRVLRRPAGLSTPESWEIHLEKVDRATDAAIRDAARTGRFEG